MRIGAVLLALAQLGVWGICAPLHRLLHHSPVRIGQAQPEPSCTSHCCAHHSHSHKSASPKNQPVDQTPDHCPEDDDHCGLCVIAQQAGCSAELVQLISAVETVVSIVEWRDIIVDVRCLRPFDGRGPPLV